MASDWIPYCKDLPRKPEVLAIAHTTGRSIGEVVATLLELWAWVDEQSPDGRVCHAPVTLLSRICHTLDASFLSAMANVGWLTISAGGIEIRNFERWMGNSAKKRASATRRKRRSRHSQAEVSRFGHASVTLPEGQERDHKTRQDSTEEDRGMNPPTTPSCPETSATSSGPLPEPAPKPASKAPPKPPGPALLTFPTDGPVKAWDLTQDVLDELAAAYPSLDVLAEAKKALAWVQADSARKKTARGMRRFLTGWLSRAQDSGRGRAATPQPQETLDERLARIRAEKGARQ